MFDGLCPGPTDVCSYIDFALPKDQGLRKGKRAELQPQFPMHVSNPLPL